ncbi:hypothetical protein MMC28_008137 [Mycoblastus sanguinarius]|nr:hypothetical protein [Mycoblastus sanguinarius]
MVAAHAYDLRAAKKVGLKTVYVRRNTEDLNEDIDLIRKEVDFFLDGTKGNKECGFGELCDVLGA